MKCEITGIITAELPPVIGTLSNGNDFEKREYVIQDSEKYHKFVKFSMISFDGPVVDPLSVGDHVTVRFTVEAREYSGKWFNDVRASYITKASSDI